MNRLTSAIPLDMQNSVKLDNDCSKDIKRRIVKATGAFEGATENAGVENVASDSKG